MSPTTCSTLGVPRRFRTVPVGSRFSGRSWPKQQLNIGPTMICSLFSKLGVYGAVNVTGYRSRKTNPRAYEPTVSGAIKERNAAIMLSATMREVRGFCDGRLRLVIDRLTSSPSSST